MPRREYYSSVSPKGQITLPAELRRDLGLNPRDQVAIDEHDGIITVKPVRSRLLRHFGRAGKLPKPMPWSDVEAVAHEDHAMRVAQSGLE